MQNMEDCCIQRKGSYVRALRSSGRGNLGRAYSDARVKPSLFWFFPICRLLISTSEISFASPFPKEFMQTWHKPRGQGWHPAASHSKLPGNPFMTKNNCSCCWPSWLGHRQKWKCDRYQRMTWDAWHSVKCWVAQRGEMVVAESQVWSGEATFSTTDHRLGEGTGAVLTPFPTHLPCSPWRYLDIVIDQVTDHTTTLNATKNQQNTSDSCSVFMLPPSLLSPNPLTSS